MLKIGMEQYCDAVIENGIDEIDILMEVTEKHLEEIGIRVGHRIRMLREIRRIREEDGVVIGKDEEKQKGNDYGWGVEKVYRTAELKTTRPDAGGPCLF